MADNTKISGPQDGKKVNVNQDHELRYWTQKWDVTEQDLRDAVKAVGVNAKDVEEYLRKNKKVK